MSNGDEIEIVLRIGLALALGSTIGFEREWRGHVAGIRTLGMVAAGAATFGELSALLDDPRISAAVVQGVGFLCAGIIFQRAHGPRGLTTAATAWATAGVGLLVAYELYLAASLVTGAFVIVLELQPLSDWVLTHSPEVRRAATRGSRGADDPDEVDTHRPRS